MARPARGAASVRAGPEDTAVDADGRGAAADASTLWAQVIACIPAHDTPERTLWDSAQRLRLRLALDLLSEAQRAVLLRLEQEFTLGQIGTITGIGRDTVKSRLHYGYGRVARAIAPNDLTAMTPPR